MISILELMRRPSVEDMQAHVDALLKANPEVSAYFKSSVEVAHARRSSRRVHCAPITDEVSYVVFLHEMGHLLSPNQHDLNCFVNIEWPLPDKMVENELDAWRWAKEKAIQWTVSMEARRFISLFSYGYREVA